MAFWVFGVPGVLFLDSARRLRFAILKVVRASQSGMLRMGKSLEEEGGKLQAEQMMPLRFTFLFFLDFLEVIEKHITTSFVKQLLWRRVKWLL